jgi:hypothetical protein
MDGRAEPFLGHPARLIPIGTDQHRHAREGAGEHQRFVAR